MESSFWNIEVSLISAPERALMLLFHPRTTLDIGGSHARNKAGQYGARAERPQIPDYGLSKSKTGMLPWKWAVKNLTESRKYLIMTVRPDGRPHAIIIWGLWFRRSILVWHRQPRRKRHAILSLPTVGSRDCLLPNLCLLTGSAYRGVAYHCGVSCAL